MLIYIMKYIEYLLDQKHSVSFQVENGQRPAEIWDNFERSRKEVNSGNWAICKMRRSGMQGIP